MINYYILLKIAENADEETIRQTIKIERRIWNQRANHPKQEIRAEAEQKIKEIAEAEKILLNSSQRRAYNQELVNAIPESLPTTEGTESEKDWLRLTVEYISNGDYSAAAYAAKEATKQHPNNADAWYWKGVASSNLGDVHNADFALHEAVRLNPREASYIVELGDLHRGNSSYADALRYYQQADNIDGNNGYILTCIAACLIGSDRTADALPVVERAYIIDRSNEFTSYILAIAICDTIGQAWSGGTTITNMRQLNYTQEQVSKLQSLNVDDTDLKQQISQLQAIVYEAEEVKFRGLRYGTLSGWEFNARKLPQVLLRTGLQ